MPEMKSNINESIQHQWLFLIITIFFLILGRLLGISFDPLSRPCFRLVLTSRIAYSLFDSQPLLEQEPALSLTSNLQYRGGILTWLSC